MKYLDFCVFLPQNNKLFCGLSVLNKISALCTPSQYHLRLARYCRLRAEVVIMKYKFLIDGVTFSGNKTLRKIYKRTTAWFKQNIWL